MSAAKAKSGMLTIRSAVRRQGVSPSKKAAAGPPNDASRKAAIEAKTDGRRTMPPASSRWHDALHCDGSRRAALPDLRAFDIPPSLRRS